MKKLFLSVLTFTVLGIAMNAQANVQEEAPSIITTAFNKLFPKATDLVWEQDDQEHVIYFNEGKMAKYCRLNAQGKWLEKGVMMTTDLATNVMDMITSSYGDIELSQKYSVTLLNKTQATLVIFTSDGEPIEMLVASNGTILRERYLPIDDEEEEEEDDSDDWK